jgi:hypothetical protein
MGTNTTGTVVFLDSHPASRSARRRSLELRDAMRRHPSSQSALAHDLDDSELAGDLAVVLPIFTH